MEISVEHLVLLLSAIATIITTALIKRSQNNANIKIMTDKAKIETDKAKIELDELNRNIVLQEIEKIVKPCKAELEMLRQLCDKCEDEKTKYLVEIAKNQAMLEMMNYKVEALKAFIKDKLGTTAIVDLIPEHKANESH